MRPWNHSPSKVYPSFSHLLKTYVRIILALELALIYLLTKKWYVVYITICTYKNISIRLFVTLLHQPGLCEDNGDNKQPGKINSGCGLKNWMFLHICAICSQRQEINIENNKT